MIFTAKETATIYKQPDNTGAWWVRLKAGQTAEITKDRGDGWLENGEGRYIEKKRGTLSGSEPPPPPVDPSTRWGVIIPDYEQHWGEDFNFVHHVSRPKRNDPNITATKGLPATGRFTLDTRVRFTKDLQYWIHGLCCEQLGVPPDKYLVSYKSEHASLWRQGAFMTNDAGTDMYADHINGTKLSKGDPKIQPMGCAGTLLKIVGETTRDYIFEAINPTRNYRQYHPSNPAHQHLFFPPDNSRREWRLLSGWDESICIPFGQYQNKALIPILGNGNTNRNQIGKWRVRILFPGEPVPSPFNTSGGFVYPNPYEGMTG